MMASQQNIITQKQDLVIRTLFCEEPSLSSFSSLCRCSLGDTVYAKSLRGPQAARQEHGTEIC